MIVERIDDIREDKRAANFWRLARGKENMKVESAKLLVQLRFRPRRRCGLIEPLCDSQIMWDLIQAIRKHGFRPMPGDEIMLAATERFQPINGTHRGVILRALDLPVPALLVDNWKNNRPEGKVRWQPQES